MLSIHARLTNDSATHQARVTLATNDREHRLEVAPKPDGRGLATNGGELLCLALATCFCNDVHREAAQRGIVVDRVEVEARAEFGGAGEPARAISYRVRIAARASETEIRALLEHTDRVAEIQNTVRQGLPVTLAAIEVESQGDPEERSTTATA